MANLLSYKFEYNAEAFNQRAAFLRKFHRVVAGIVKEVHQEIEFDGLKKLTFEPGSPHYPIDWQTEKQRRAYFATNGFGGGIPTKRTGAIRKGWEILYVPTDGGGTIAIRNKHKAVKYVQGKNQQRFHAATGWPLAQPIVSDLHKEALSLVKEKFTESLGAFGKVGGKLRTLAG